MSAFENWLLNLGLKLSDLHDDGVRDGIEIAFKAGKAAEREACAKMLTEWDYDRAAMAIRSRDPNYDEKLEVEESEFSAGFKAGQVGPKLCDCGIVCPPAPTECHVCVNDE